MVSAMTELKLQGNKVLTPITAIETDTTVPDAPAAHDIPDGGYGWVVVFGIAIINAFAWGVSSSFSVYLAFYLDNNYFPGASSLGYSFVGGTNFLAALWVAPFVNILARHAGTKACIMVGAGVGFLFVSTVPIISQWFWKKRSFAQGITAGGSGIGGLIFSASISPMIQNISLAWALRIQGIICFVTLFLASTIVRDRNHHLRPKQHPFDIRFFRRWDVWLLLIWAFLYLLGYMTLLSSLPDFIRSLGLSPSEASLPAILLNLATITGRVGAGFVSDRYGRITIALISSIATGVLCLVFWIPSQSLAPTLVFSFIVGNVYSTIWPAIAPLAAEIVGLEELPSLLAIVWLTTGLPCFFSEAIALQLRRPDSDRPYLYAQLYAGLSYIASALFMLELRRMKVGLFKQERRLQ
uniref:Putative transporter MCH2 n=1 Tax=Talaromyces marneffei PM1 TaxID=1077442 RepID=A0A093VQ93_TALMA